MKNKNRSRLVLIGAFALAAAALIGYLIFDRLFPNNYAPSVTGVPTEAINSIDARRTAQAQTKTAAPPGNSYAPVGENPEGIALIAYQAPISRFGKPQQDAPLYVSCTEDRLRARERPATVEPTAEATAAATVEAAGTPAAPDLIRLAIVGSESEACYQVGEVFAGVGEFRVAVGITRSIGGEIEIDRGNVANSLVGDIVINISEFRSDEGRRDAAIQSRWLETNRYPIATFANIEAEGLPTRPYIDGETLSFTLTGELTIREVAVPTTFEATAALTGDVLVVRAVSDVKMSDWKFDAPNMAGFVTVDDDMRIVLNLVARVIN
ncbi:MAG: YceI family protein [Anaerolineales bacterium]|nr:YceI family protein [Anaerolineales bacterium]